ncbi:hypothetical protein ASF39_12450 [Methylobacterium sp. Leaf108]|nr:hypothetical protein ASF39_12450 [Methylobacterium sp. Leaf108]
MFRSRRDGGPVSRREATMVDCDVEPACDAVPCTEVLYANGEWRVTAEGIDHPRTGYVIDRAGIDRRRDGELWEWPLHLAEKSWCEPGPLRDAFMVALGRYGVAADPDLMRSFAIGFGPRFGSGRDIVDLGFTSLGEIVSRRRHGGRKPPGPLPSDVAWRRDETGDRRRVAVAGR